MEKKLIMGALRNKKSPGCASEMTKLLNCNSIEEEYVCEDKIKATLIKQEKLEIKKKNLLGETP